MDWVEEGALGEQALLPTV
ncbi:hypothetical protein RF55_23219, partial [Lasius niger]